MTLFLCIEIGLLSCTATRSRYFCRFCSVFVSVFPLKGLTGGESINPHWEPNGLSQVHLQCKTPYWSGCRKLARLSRVLFPMSQDCIRQTLSVLGCPPICSIDEITISLSFYSAFFFVSFLSLFSFLFFLFLFWLLCVCSASGWWWGWRRQQQHYPSRLVTWVRPSTWLVHSRQVFLGWFNSLGLWHICTSVGTTSSLTG